MPIPFNEVLNAEIIMRGIITGGGAGEVRTNFVFHFRRTAVAVDPSKGALFTAFNTNIATPIAAALNEDWAATTTSIRYINDPLDAPIEFSSVLVGAITGDRLASFSSAFLLMRTAVRGKNYRGSKHLGPFSETDVTHATGCDVFNAGCVTRLNTICTAVTIGFADSTTNQWVCQVLSRDKSQLANYPCTVVANDVIQCIPNQRVGTEVRRKAASIY